MLAVPSVARTRLIAVDTGWHRVKVTQQRLQTFALRRLAHAAGHHWVLVKGRLGASPLMSSARLLERVFDLDLEHCPNCGGELKTMAAILEQR